jgi:uncharacterized protein YndB with AHSA1/START domain
MRASDSAATDARVHELTITRVLDAPREVVFAAWTDAKQAAQWWGPEGFTTISCEMDVRVGGTYRACMRSPEGTRHCRRGVYREVVRPERLAFTFAWEDAAGNPGHETILTVTFADTGGGKTRLTLHQAMFETASARDAHHTGWASCLERFAAYLATAPADH